MSRLHLSASEGPVRVFVVLAVTALPLGFTAKASGQCSFEVAWVLQLEKNGWDESYSQAVAIDSVGNPYMSGFTFVQDPTFPLPGFGQWDAFLTKYDSSGSLLWNHSFESKMAGYKSSVALDALDNAYLFIGADAVLAKYDSLGTLLSARPVDVANWEPWGNPLAADAPGNVYVCGLGPVGFGGPGYGGTDFVVAKYDVSGSLL